MCLRSEKRKTLCSAADLREHKGGFKGVLHWIKRLSQNDLSALWRTKIRATRI